MGEYGLHAVHANTQGDAVHCHMLASFRAVGGGSKISADIYSRYLAIMCNQSN